MTRDVPTIYQGSVVAGEAPRIMARVEDNTGTALTQSDVSSIAYTIYNPFAASTSLFTGTLTVANVVYDTLQDDSAWDVDSTGYNFAWAVTDSTAAYAGKTLRIEVRFTLADASLIVVVWDVDVMAKYAGT